MELENKSILKRNEDLLANNVGEDLVMMSIQDGKYFALNKTGAIIWNLLEDQLLYSQLCEKLSSTYQISVSQCHEDINPFIEELIREKIIISE